KTVYLRRFAPHRPVLRTIAQLAEVAGPPRVDVSLTHHDRDAATGRDAGDRLWRLGDVSRHSYAENVRRQSELSVRVAAPGVQLSRGDGQNVSSAGRLVHEP